MKKTVQKYHSKHQAKWPSVNHREGQTRPPWYIPSLLSLAEYLPAYHLIFSVSTLHLCSFLIPPGLFLVSWSNLSTVHLSYSFLYHIRSSFHQIFTYFYYNDMSAIYSRFFYLFFHTIHNKLRHTYSTFLGFCSISVFQSSLYAESYIVCLFSHIFQTCTFLCFCISHVLSPSLILIIAHNIIYPLYTLCTDIFSQFLRKYQRNGGNKSKDQKVKENRIESYSLFVSNPKNHRKHSL